MSWYVDVSCNVYRQNRRGQRRCCIPRCRSGGRRGRRGVANGGVPQPGGSSTFQWQAVPTKAVLQSARQRHVQPGPITRRTARPLVRERDRDCAVGDPGVDEEARPGRVVVFADVNQARVKKRYRAHYNIGLQVKHQSTPYIYPPGRKQYMSCVEWYRAGKMRGNRSKTQA